jgi:DNA polymerase/3'-5' exonuclease PolX
MYGLTGFRWGEKYRGVDFRAFNHELFMADADNWGAVFLIRTGPAEFSERVVTLIKATGMYRQQDGYLVHVATGERVTVPDEETYLRYAGMSYVEPEKTLAPKATVARR